MTHISYWRVVDIPSKSKQRKNFFAFNLCTVLKFCLVFGSFESHLPTYFPDLLFHLCISCSLANWWNCWFFWTEGKICVAINWVVCGNSVHSLLLKNKRISYIMTSRKICFLNWYYFKASTMSSPEIVSVPDSNTKIRLISPDRELQYREWYINFNYSFSVLSSIRTGKKKRLRKEKNNPP